ncbi:MAG TPA: aminotransferase class I/II-fold pyridoxal phosphate-dependent enzyme [Gemmatimonadaceae bacterium]|nr:aminotransferase class I/II-fold pyridoxal phosphate-dependent enzyme [Gemmatimonadaceae bacterium]
MTASVRLRPASTAANACAPSHRLSDLPTYVFAWLDELKAAARARGADLIDLGMGNPDQPTPPAIVESIAAAFRNPANHGYPPFRGTPRFREAVSRYMKSRFDVDVDPETEVLCLSGAKEGIAHLTMGFTDEHTVTIVPDIYYPVHGRATGLVGGKVHLVPLRAEAGFLPDLSRIPESVLRAAKLLVLNYPHNPTGSVAPLRLYEEAVALCRAHGITLLSDLAYVELTYDGTRAPSALEVPGAKEVTVEFHSFSKSFNMAGSRIGFAVGGKPMIDALHAVRTNMGYGTPAAIQEGAAFALDHAPDLIEPGRARYERRRNALVEGFRSLGWDARPSKGSMFVWLPVPGRHGSQEWTERLIDQAGVVVTPGNAFGPGGEGFFRVSLIADEAVLATAIERLRRAGVRFDS